MKTVENERKKDNIETFRLSSIRVVRMVSYLLKARNVESEKQPLLCNYCVTRNHGVNVASGVFFAVRAKAK
jgi:hypothetical protein